MAVFDAANDIRKWLNYIAPPVAIVLAIVYSIWFSTITAGPFSFLTNIFGGGGLSGWVITELILAIIGIVLYYIPKIGPFWGIKEGEVHVWPEHIMTLVCAILLTVAYWGGILMWILWVFVWFLADYPIWEPMPA